MTTKDRLLQVFALLSDKYGQMNWWPADTRDEMIIGSILTQNTSWSNVEKAILNLKDAGLCDLGAIADIKDINILANLIKPSGYYNIKANRLMTVAIELSKEIYRNPDFSDTDFREKLLNINGIGPETADSILLYGYHRPFFVIDTYTKRLFSRLGFVDEKQSYAFFQNFFMSALPKDVQLYNDYHALIVIHCKDFCKKKPLCADCCVQKLCKGVQ